jgi:hypothetical protein
MRMRRLSLRWVPVWMERLLGLWRLWRLLLVLGSLPHLLDQILKRRVQRRELMGRVKQDPAHLSYGAGPVACRASPLGQHAAILHASSFVSSLAADRRPGSSSK